MEILQVAKTILEQLGGRKFIVMTGAKNFVAGDDSLSFRLPGARGFTKQGINVITITLEPSDTYTVIFARMRKDQLHILATRTDVYFDSLQAVFTHETGLETHL